MTLLAERKRPTLTDSLPGLRPVRIERGLSQGELAERMGVSRTTVVRWEDATSLGPTIATLKRLCEVLDCDADTLLYWTGDEIEELAREFAS